MENLLVALSNYPVLDVINLAYARGDVLTLTIVSYVGLGSFLSHLFENHKHGMPGWYLSQETSYALNRIDVSGVILTIARFGYLYYCKYGLTYAVLMENTLLVCLALVGVMLNLLSEHDKYNANLKWLYIPTHALWHIIIFSCMTMFYAQLL